MAPIQLSEADAGHTAKVDRGNAVEIALPETPTTGYRWTWVLGAGVRTVFDDYVPAPPGRPGQGGRRRLLVEVDVPGRHRLRAELARPWEPAALRVLTFELDATAG